jgi:hypothetical protein
MLNRADLNDPLITPPRKDARSALVALMSGVTVVLGMAVPAQAGTSA